jgi:ornithine cyclodeaminase
MPALTNIDVGMESPEIRKVLDFTGLYEAWFEENPKPVHRSIPVVGIRFLDLVHEGRIARSQLEDLAKIVSGEAPGRKSDEDIIIMSVGGMPVEDVAWATVVYRNALERDIGIKLNLWQQPLLR